MKMMMNFGKVSSSGTLALFYLLSSQLLSVYVSCARERCTEVHV